MRECESTEVRDLLPEYARGALAAGDRAGVDAHLAGCASCRAEIALLRAVRTAHPAPAVDVARIVAALPRPSRTAPIDAAPGVVSLDAHRARRAAERAPLPWRRVAAVAAVVVGVVSVGVMGTRLGDGPGATRAAVTPVEGAAATATAVAMAGETASRTASPGARPAEVVAVGESARAVTRSGTNGGARLRGAAARPADALGTLGGVTSDVTDAELDALLAGLETLSGIPVVEESDAVDASGGEG